MITKERARQLRKLIEKAAISLDDGDALDGLELFPHWNDSSKYEVNDRVQYNGTLYKCLAAHTSQSSWTPDYSPSLWVRVDNPGEEFPEWVQPLGSTDAYPAGAKVSYEGKHWISTIDGNVWAPGTYGWDEI